MRRSALRRPASLSDRYRIVGKIGEGTYGIVFKAEAYPNSSGHNRGSNTPNSATNNSSSTPTAASATNASNAGGMNAASATTPTSAVSASGVGVGGSNGNAEEDELLTFAIKLVKSHKEGKNDVVLSSATVREIKLLRELQHDNVVHLHDVYVDPRDKTLALVFEYADHDLHDIIVQSKQRPLSEYTKKSFMHQILKGVDYMHDAWVMHRDMKPQNILVVAHGRRRGQVKLADFGLARLYKEPIKALSEVERVVVTLWYRAPELLLGAKHYTKAVDMWAVGCIFAELINARELFCGKEVEGSNAPFQKDQLDKIFKVLGMPTPQNWPGVESLPEYQNVVQMGRERKYPVQSELRNAVKFGTGRNGVALQDLIARMLEYDPEKRITAKEALQHEYFTQLEPEPHDRAFDEPGKEPVSFRTQNIEPISEEQLPWRSGKREANVDASSANATAAAAAAGAKGIAESSPQQRGHPRNGSQHPANEQAYRRESTRIARQHHNASASAPRDATMARTRSEAAATNATNASGAGGPGWRDRNAANASTTGAKRPLPATDQGNANRPRSPKQTRRR